MRNLKIKHFEVAAISIIEGVDISLDNIDAGPVSRKVAVQGSFSEARQLLGFLKTLRAVGHYCNQGRIKIRVNWRNLSVGRIIRSLKNLMRDTERKFLRGQYNKINKFMINKSRLPDGGTLYGINFHQTVVSVGPFNVNDVKNFLSRNVKMKNIRIHDMALHGIERPALLVDGETRSQSFLTGQKDAIGASFDIMFFTSKKGRYISNPIGNAQLIVSKYKKCLFDHQKQFRELNQFFTNTRRDSISPKVLSWAATGKRFKRKFVCNTDQMLHASKGFVSLRLSGVSNVLMENVTIQNVRNQTPFGSKVCGNYKDSFSMVNTIPGFLGADMRGITVESCKDVVFRNVTLNKVKSSHGNAIGVDVMFRSFNV